MKKTVIVLAASLVLGACAGLGHQPKTFEELAKEAEAAIDKADKVGYEWRDSRKILEAAKKAHVAGDETEAMKLATKALHQGRMAYQQYLDNRDASPWQY